jgi:predicted small lipoprotein YifL
MRPVSQLRFALLAAALALSGCGQKGPLFLPEASGEIVTRPTQTPAAPAPATVPAAPSTPPPTPDKPAPNDKDTPAKPIAPASGQR